MAYRASLNGTQQLTISNQGIQTKINLTTSSPGQQQSQGNSFTTGNWVKQPQLFRTGENYIVQIESTQGQYFIGITAYGMSTINGIPSTSNAIPVDLESIASDNFTQPKVKFEPMQPPRMGNMSMQMGNMSMSMGSQSRQTVTKRFCSQCGVEVKVSDRFCSSCGHQLNS